MEFSPFASPHSKDKIKNLALCSVSTFESFFRGLKHIIFYDKQVKYLNKKLKKSVKYEFYLFYSLILKYTEYNNYCYFQLQDVLLKK